MAASTFADVTSHFDTVRSDQIAASYSRRNPAAKVVGVRYGDIEKIARQVKQRTALALDLWATEVFEARTSAMRAIDPADVTSELADRRACEIDFPTLADEWAGLVYQTPFGRETMESWTASEDEFVRRAGYSLVFRFAAEPESAISDELLLAFLGQIEREIHESPNWAREMMNAVPVAIGLQAPDLHVAALATARAYSPISVYHGDKTTCKIRNVVDDLTDPKVKVHV